ncbi:MAG: hypothetical protein OXI20_10450 [Rhodospirillales bacterium]|nr:hypothetical protein [Rhodospirillales bacterium]
MFASDGGDPFGYRPVVEDYSGLGDVPGWAMRGRPRGYWEPQVSRVHRGIVAGDTFPETQRGALLMRAAFLNMICP